MSESKEKIEKQKSNKAGLFALIFLIIILVGVQYSMSRENFVKGANTSKANQTNKEVEKAKENINQNFEEKIENIKDQVANLEPADIISDSAQFKKLISDLETLKGLPKNQVKSACESICQSI